jgi:alpha-mannosidase
VDRSGAANDDKVEMDTNVPSGEALCRQFLYGQRYYESRFGARSEIFVLPDTCELVLALMIGHD